MSTAPACGPSCPPLNMHRRRRGTDKGDQFDLAGLIVSGGGTQPARGTARPCLLLAQRVGAEEIRRGRALEEVQLDEAPGGQNEYGSRDRQQKVRVGQAVLEMLVNSGPGEE